MSQSVNEKLASAKRLALPTRTVINQFLIESCVIGLLGGILGYAIGIGGAYAASLYLPFAPVLQWQVAAIGIGIATTTGVLFGIYPAVRATKKNPVESLRY